MTKANFSKLLVLCLSLLMGVGAYAQTTLKGKVTDEGGEALIGASVVVKGTTTGTSTDIDGNFSLSVNEATPFTLRITYTGYKATEMEISGNQSGLSIQLAEDAITSGEIIVSASRKKEKVQEAPASVSVISEKKLEVSAQATDPVRNLNSLPGVQVSQQSANRINIEMREASSLFGTTVFPIMDYRSLVGPGIGTFSTDQVGLSTLDLKSIEVVRGPGSALYGPGVSSGVVHFITKNPIDYPGTSVEVIGGEMNTFGGTLRHATKVNDKFGFKINAQYRRGDEFTLDGTEGTLDGNGNFIRQIDKFQTTVSQPGVDANGVVNPTLPATTLLTQSDLDPDNDGNMMQDFWWNYAINATLEFRPQDNLSIFLSGGVNEASSVFYNSQGEGLSQGTESWIQTRMQWEGLFAQVFYVNNNGGPRDKPTFLYQTGLRTSIAREQLEGQLQYNFLLDKVLNSDWTVGVDYRQAISDSENLVYGRNEDDDDYRIIGIYAQSKFKLGDKLDLLLAGRYDDFNFMDDGGFSPRAALVYKINPKHTVRLTYNKAVSAPSALNVNIDFPISVPVPGLFDAWLAGMKDQHIFGDNPMIDVTVPGVPDLPYGLPGLPLSVPYGATAADGAAAVVALMQQNGLTDATLLGLVGAYFADPANAPTGTTGTFDNYDISTGAPMPATLSDTDPIQLVSTDNYEFGYKGLIADKLSVMADLYFVKRTGFYQFTAIGPTIALNNAQIATDLGNAVGTGLNAHLIGAQVDAATAGAIAAIANGVFNQAGAAVDAQMSPLYSIFGAVESSLMPQNDDITHVSIGYRTFADESYDYTGLDFGLEYYATDDISLFFNYSWVSQVKWIPGESNDDGLPFKWFLNMPQNKFRLGGHYVADSGFRGSLIFQHDDSFETDLGQYSGTADEKNLVDLSIGYKFDGNVKGLSIDVTGQNVFNSEYRPFPNFPKIGRRIVAKVTYVFGDGE